MRRMILGAAALATLLLGAPASASAGTLDQQQTDDTGGFIGISSGSAAQTFTVGITGKLDKVDLSLETSGNLTPLVVQIRNSSGVPGAMVLASQDLPGSAVPSLHVFVPVHFDSPASVVAGAQYAIVAYTSGGSLYKWARGAGDSYAGGVGFTSSSSPPSGSVFWTSQPSDFTFKTYVIPAPPPAGPTDQRAAALRKCKKKHSKKARRKCRKKAALLPV